MVLYTYAYEHGNNIIEKTQRQTEKTEKGERRDGMKHYN